MTNTWGFMVPMLASIWIVPAPGEVTMEKYHDVKGTQSFKEYIGGVGTGFFWANAHQHIHNLPPLYCQPGKLPLYADSYLQILGDYISNRPGEPNSLANSVPVELLLLNALRETFPCK